MFVVAGGRCRRRGCVCNRMLVLIFVLLHVGTDDSNFFFSTRLEGDRPEGGEVQRG